MTAFVDGVTAYTVTRSEEYDGWIVVVVNSEEQGYHHAFTQYVLYFSEEKAQEVADNLNHQMGIYKDEELAVTACSMFPGTKYEDALQRFRDKRRPARPQPGGAEDSPETFVPMGFGERYLLEVLAVSPEEILELRKEPYPTPVPPEELPEWRAKQAQERQRRRRG